MLIPRSANYWMGDLLFYDCFLVFCRGLYPMLFPCDPVRFSLSSRALFPVIPSVARDLTIETSHAAVQRWDPSRSLRSVRDDKKEHPVRDDKKSKHPVRDDKKKHPVRDDKKKHPVNQRPYAFLLIQFKSSNATSSLLIKVSSPLRNHTRGS